MQVKTIYLEIHHTDEFRPKKGFRERVEIKEIENDAYMNFILFAGVGLPWRWYSRLKWTLQQWDDYFNSGRVKTFLGFDGKKLIGYYELEFDESGSAEIKFIGLFPSFMGSGLGGMLLSHAVESAWGNNAKRVWLHTCTNDADSALGNYIARGFRVFREEENSEYVPERIEMTEMVSGFFSQYIERFITF